MTAIVRRDRDAERRRRGRGSGTRGVLPPGGVLSCRSRKHPVPVPGTPRPMPRAPAGPARPFRRGASEPARRNASRRGATRAGAAQREPSGAAQRDPARRNATRRGLAGGPGSPCHTRGRCTPRHPFCLGRPITAAGGVFVACRATPRGPGGRHRARRQETWRGMHRATGHGADTGAEGRKHGVACTGHRAWAPGACHRAPGMGTGRRAPGTGHRARGTGHGPGRHPGQHRRWDACAGARPS